MDLLTKLALEVGKNDSKSPESKGSESGAGNKKASDGKKFPFNSSKGKDNGGDSKRQGRNENEKSNEKVPEFGKKTESKNGKMSEGGNGNEGENTNANGKGGANGVGEEKENGLGTGNENEIEGNESAEGPAVPGTGAIDPTTIIDFFAQNPTPNDEAYHEFAESQGIDVHQAETVAYALAGKYVMFLRGGKSNQTQMDMTQIDPEQLRIGMEIESEHSDDPATQKKIFLDHYSEDREYYNKLKKYVEGNNEQVVAEPKNEAENKFKKNDDKQSKELNGDKESKEPKEQKE